MKKKLWTFFKARFEIDVPGPDDLQAEGSFLDHEYRLTPKGADLSPALVALMHWGDRWYATDGPPTLLVHDSCGTPLDQAVSCPFCEKKVCRACHGKDHAGMSCEAAARAKETDKQSQGLIEATTKACPHCGFRVSHWHGHACPSKVQLDQ